MCLRRLLPTLRLATLALVSVALHACSADETSSSDAAMSAPTPITDVAGLQALFDEVRAEVYPELAEARIDLLSMAEVGMESETDFFVSNLDLATAGDPPLERAYRVLYNSKLFDDPPPRIAFEAILVHELKHTLDFTERDARGLLEIAALYTRGEIAEYERATDAFTLDRGYGEGLKAYRLWLYSRLDAEGVAEKRRDYYTPEEIDARLEGR